MENETKVQKKQPDVEKKHITIEQARRDIEIEDLFIAGCALNQPANS